MHSTTPGSLGPLRQLQIAPLDLTTPELVPRGAVLLSAVHYACRATLSVVPDENQRASPPTRVGKRTRTPAPSLEVKHSPVEVVHDSG
jgi:hypothetical protein